MSAQLPIVPGLSFRLDSNHTPSSLPLPGQLLLITDHLAAPADIVLHRALAIYLKEPNQPQTRRVVLVSIAGDYAHWRAIAAKSNVNLGRHLKAGTLAYVDGLSLSALRDARKSPPNAAVDGYVACAPLGSVDGVVSLKGLYDVIVQSLQDASDDYSTNQTVIIDDITLLELIGVPSPTIIRFIRALRALCRRHSAALIIRAHATPSSSSANDQGTPFDSDILRMLLDSCHAHVEVRPLASGKSGGVSGEIALHRGGLAMGCGNEGGGAVMGRKMSLQYRLSDGGAVFFQKGLGAGVL